MNEFLGPNWELITLEYLGGKEVYQYKWKLPGVAAPYVKRRFEQEFPGYDYHLHYIGGQGTFTTVSKLREPRE